MQSALLEAMAERQITIGRKTYNLPELFLVMATQNPIEQEGTYPLPEAQLDRFLMYVKIDYPEINTEKKILYLTREEARKGIKHVQGQRPTISQKSILLARYAVLDVHLSESLEEYLVQLVIATRQPEAYSRELAQWLRFGASPRATMALDRCARAHAWLNKRDFVTPEDIHSVAYEVLRHRILLNFEAEAEGINTDHFIKELLSQVAVP